MPEPVAAPASNKQKGKRIFQAIAILVLLGLFVLAYWFFFMRGIVKSDDARFNGHLVDLAPEIAGTLEEVYFHEGEPVTKGQPAFQLNRNMLRATLAQMQAQQETARGNLEAAQARQLRAVNGPRPEEIKAAEASLRKMQAEETLAQLEMERAESLNATGATTKESLDRASSAYSAAQQSAEQVAQNLAILKQGTRAEDIQAAKADVAIAMGRLAEAEAAVAKAKDDLARASVEAPFSGVVVRRWLEPGAMVAVGRPVLTVFDPTTLRIDANIEEKYLHDVAIGDTVDISVDAFPKLELQGRVTDILRAVNSEFSMIPSEGVSGTFVKVQQRVPLRITVQAPDNLPIGPGLSVTVRIKIGSAK
jgi:membrane fusion protein, multidrug efflux system